MIFLVDSIEKYVNFIFQLLIYELRFELSSFPLVNPKTRN